MLKIFNKKMKLSKIKISKEFKNHPPRWTKMLDKQVFYIEHGRFEQPIILDENNYLVDGYTTYLLAKQLRKRRMPVKRINL